MKKGLIITGIILVVIVGFGMYFYNSVISPTAEKPVIEKPPIPVQTVQNTAAEQVVTGESKEEMEAVEIEEEHIQYLVNEIGGYNLHDDPISDEPAIMQFDVTDIQKSYTITIEDNFPTVEEGEAQNPDVIMHANQAVLVELLQAEDFNAKTVELMEAGDMWMEIVADEKTLALKGYKSIYDQVTGGDDTMPTANVIRSLDWP